MSRSWSCHLPLYVMVIAIVICINVLPKNGYAEETSGESPSDTHVTVVLFSMNACCADRSWPEVEERLHLELIALGLQVFEAPADEQVLSADLQDLLQLNEIENTAAVVRIIKQPQTDAAFIDIVAVDKHNGETVLRHIPIRNISSSRASLHALKAAEAIRVSLLELELLKEEVSDDIPEPIYQKPDSQPSPTTARTATSEQSEGSPWGIGIAVLAQMDHTSDIDVLGSFSMNLLWRWHTILIQLDIIYSAFGATVPVQRTTATFDLGMLRGWFYYRLLRWHALQIFLGAGGGAAIPWSQGHDAYPYGGNKAAGLVGYLGGSVRFSYRLLTQFSIFSSVYMGGLLPKTEIRFQEREVAEFGQPLSEFLLGAEFNFM